MADQYQPRVIRVFVSAVLRDMQAERDYLHKFTFPRLGELCASRGVILDVVDLRRGIAGEDTAQENVLQFTLEELQRSRPYYIGLIGEGYGRVVEHIPDELLRRWPLLAQYHGRSTNELEIVFGVLTDEAMRGRGFFYFRDSKSIDIEAQEESEESVQGSQDARKLDDLKQSIRDVSQQGICRLRENYRNVEELGEWILDDFRQLIDKLWPVPERQTEVTPYDDDVMFTVYRAGTVVPQKWYSLLAFAHLSERRPDAPADEPDPLAEVHRQAQQILGEKMAEYRESSQESSSSVPHAGEITFKPFITGFDFNPSSRSFRWEESVHREEFKMRAATAPDGEVAKGWLRVYLGPLILAQINLSIKVDSKSVSQSERQAPAMESARPLRKVFASYSHKDRAIVERIEEIVSHTHLGIEYLRDATNLRVGEEWSPRLRDMIREAHAFQLFWSTNSMCSDFVRQEYQYALSLGREHFVLPVYWETPFPERPEDGLPPDELRRLHFEKLAKSIANLHRPSAREAVPSGSSGLQDSNRELTTSRVSRSLAERTDELVRCRRCGLMGHRSSEYCRACGFAYSTSDSPDSYAEVSQSMAAGSPTRASTEVGDLPSASRDRKRGKTPAISVAVISAAAIIVAGMIGLFPLSTSREPRNAIVSSTNSNLNSNRRFETGGRVEGSLKDLAGHPIADMTVSIRNGPEAKTDEDGNFVLNNVPVGVQLIEIQSPSSKGTTTQSVRITPNQTASVSVIFDSGASRLGLLSITDPVDGSSLEVGRVGSEFQAVVYGRCDGLTEILGQFDVWVLIRTEHDSRFWLQHPPAVIDPNSNTWRARVVFGGTGHPPKVGEHWDIVAVAARADSEIGHILNTPNLNLLPTHVRSSVVTVESIER